MPTAAKSAIFTSWKKHRKTHKNHTARSRQVTRDENDETPNAANTLPAAAQNQDTSKYSRICREECYEHHWLLSVWILRQISFCTSCKKRREGKIVNASTWIISPPLLPQALEALTQMHTWVSSKWQVNDSITSLNTFDHLCISIWNHQSSW